MSTRFKTSDLTIEVLDSTKFNGKPEHVITPHDSVSVLAVMSGSLSMTLGRHLDRVTLEGVQAMIIRPRTSLRLNSFSAVAMLVKPVVR